MADKTTFNNAASNDNESPRVLLALAGGGSHGAFTAGALQALEEHGVLDNIVGVSGTSAGANNAACVVAGIESNEKGGVTKLLNKLWGGIGRKGDSLKLFKDWNRMIYGVSWPNLPHSFKSNMGFASKIGSMYGAKSQSGHVRDQIEDVIDDWGVIAKSKIKTVIGAARIAKDSSGREVLVEHNFTNKDIDANAVAASGCLVGTHTKDGAEFKDGAYVKNPPISNVMPKKGYTDILAIMLAPEPDHSCPSHENTLIPNDELIREETYSHLAYEVKKNRHHVHVIKMKLPPEVNDTSKLNFDSKWIDTLHTLGYHAGLEWVREHKADLGVRDSYKPKTADDCCLQSLPEVA